MNNSRLSLWSVTFTNQNKDGTLLQISNLIVLITIVFHSQCIPRELSAVVEFFNS